MYVYVCPASNDRQVNHAVHEGKCSVRELREHFGHPPTCCGKCFSCMRSLINECLNIQASATWETCP